MNKAPCSMIAALSLGLAVSASAQTLTNPVTISANSPHHGAMVTQRGGISPQFGSAFYDNTADQGFFFNAGAGSEVADDIGFNGTFLVDGFQFGYDSDPASTVPTADLSVKFYDADPGTFAPSNEVAAFDLTGLPAGPNVIDIDLAGTGKEFLWSDGGLGLGWLSLTFSDDAFGWELATGGTSQDIFYWVSPPASTGLPADFYFFGGDPQASFLAKVYGHAVPEPGALSLFAGVLAGGGLLALRRRK